MFKKSYENEKLQQRQIIWMVCFWTKQCHLKNWVPKIHFLGQKWHFLGLRKQPKGPYQLKLDQIWRQKLLLECCNQSCMIFFFMWDIKKVYISFGSFLTKANGFFTRLKITWVDLHVTTIILLYGNLFWTLLGSLWH